MNLMVILRCLKAYRYDYLLNFHEKAFTFKTLYQGSSYATAYNSYNVFDSNKMLAFLKLPVNCLLGSWYYDIKYAYKIHQMKRF